MAAEDKTYSPQEIQDQATGDAIAASGADTASKSSSMASYKPVATVEKKYPTIVVARELLSSALDTVSKKIKGTFTFSKIGAIKIGEYVFGVSGEVSISPNGITATNVNGTTTVGIDGTTGDAFFSGELRTGSVVTGAVTVGGNGNNGSIVLLDDSDVPFFVAGEV